ncbi:hypothetical protein V502_07651 [Pseudogymnoascus sp. VKM F-4520 (FW-2644)]|nr:hypothetical protein V502_07651 [Pseudogymnoascus sp. VKM F-4520 (FW-2644)]
MAGDDELIDVQGYLRISDTPAYNPQYPPLADSRIRRNPVLVAVPPPPPPAGAPWVAPASWGVLPRPAPGHQLSPPAPQRPPPPPPAPITPPAAPLPRAPSPVHLHVSARTRTLAEIAHEEAALQALNRFAFNREAAEASDAAAAAATALAIASAADPVAAEAEATEVQKDFHRGLALSRLEGRTITRDDGRPLTAAGAAELVYGEPEEQPMTFGEWSRAHRWRLPAAWGGGDGDPNFIYFDHDHDVGDEPACFRWGCWLCYCGPGCCGGGGRSARNRRAWTPGNLD